MLNINFSSRNYPWLTPMIEGLARTPVCRPGIQLVLISRFTICYIPGEINPALAVLPADARAKTKLINLTESWKMSVKFL